MTKLDRIDSVYLFVASDETGEGVCGAPLLGPGTMVPLIAADEKRLASIRPVAEMMVREFGQKIKLIKFTTREEIEDIGAGA